MENKKLIPGFSLALQSNDVSLSAKDQKLFANAVTALLDSGEFRPAMNYSFDISCLLADIDGQKKLRFKYSIGFNRFSVRAIQAFQEAIGAITFGQLSISLKNGRSMRDETRATYTFNGKPLNVEMLHC